MARVLLFLLGVLSAAIFAAVVSLSSPDGSSGFGGAAFGNSLKFSSSPSAEKLSFGDNRKHEQKQLPKSLLLPMPMDFLRRGLPLSVVYNFPDQEFSGDCSCYNPDAKGKKCCARNFRRTHKQGTMMTQHFFDSYNIAHWHRPYYYKYSEGLPKSDWRDVLLMRNIYDSLVSG